MALHLSLQSFWNLLFLITDAFFRPYLAFQTSNQVTRSTIYYTAYLASMIKSDVCIHAPLLDIRLLGYKTSFTDQPNQSITHLCHFQSVVKEMQYTSEQWAHTNPEWFACLVCSKCAHRLMQHMCSLGLGCTRMGNQSCFRTLQEVINSQDYCADSVISKVLHNSLCGEGWLNRSTWKRKERRQVRSILSRPICLSLSSCRQSPLWERRSLNIKAKPGYLGDRNN